MNRNEKTELEIARDELFGHIHRCGVLGAAPADQEAWMDDTIGYLGECHPELKDAELGELRVIGMRFCSPVIDCLDRADESDELAMAS
jgi:hypothetical protein